MSKTNCWTVKACGREPGGAKAAELGLCPAATNATFNNVNSGNNAGRVCWAVTGTLCGGKVQGSFAQKQLSCMNCDFYQRVKSEEGQSFVLKPQSVRI